MLTCAEIEIFGIFKFSGLHIGSVWHASVQKVAFFESFGVHVAQRNGEVAIVQRSLEESEV